MPLPEPERDRAHYEGCWRDPTHHACAVAGIAELNYYFEQYADLAEKLSAIGWSHCTANKELIDSINDLMHRAEGAEAALATARAEIERLTARVAWDDALGDAAREPLCVRCAALIRALKDKQP